MYLFSFIGNTDLAAAGLIEGCEEPEGGPLARALASGIAPWCGATLLDDRPDPNPARDFVAWLRRRIGGVPLRLFRCPVRHPADFDDVWTAASAVVLASGTPASERAYLATPGTVVMGMAWLHLALQPATRGRVLTAHPGRPCRWLPVTP